MTVFNPSTMPNPIGDVVKLGVVVASGCQRPVASRTYGFNVRRDLGLYGLDIESQVAGSNWAM